MVTNGLVLHLDFANTKSYSGSGSVVTDMSGSQNNGSLFNSPAFTTEGGGGLVFDGSNDYIRLNNNISFNITDSWSFSLWVSPASASTNTWRNIIGIEADNDCTWQFHPNGFGFYQSFYNSTTYIWFSSIRPGFTMSTDKISNITITCTPIDADRTFFTAYLNGLASSSTTFTWSPINRLQTFNRIGGNGSRYFLGNVSNVSIYNRTLSATEVLQNFNSLRGRFGI